MTGFCPHTRAIPGLDAYYCPDCKKSISAGTAAYKQLTDRPLFKGTTDEEKAEIRRRRGEDDPDKVEIARLKARVEELEAQSTDLKEALSEAATALKRAKDPRPVERPTLWRVFQLARSALMQVKRIKGGWLLSMGQKLQRRFIRLRDIWELLSQENWYLGDIFPEANSDNYVEGRYVPPPKNPRPKLPQRHGSIAPAEPDSLARGGMSSVIGAMAQLAYGYQPPWAKQLTEAT
jgi:hypothetical protein